MPLSLFLNFRLFFNTKVSVFSVFVTLEKYNCCYVVSPVDKWSKLIDLILITSLYTYNSHLWGTSEKFVAVPLQSITLRGKTMPFDSAHT